MEIELLSTEEFFAPVSSDAIDGLVGQYRAERARIEQIAAYFDDARTGVLNYFLEGNLQQDNSRYSALSAEKIFQLSGAIAALNAAYWDRTLKMTDVLDVMPAARRNEWHETIQKMQTPDYTEETVRATLLDVLSSRQKFFAERVDGIFRALSRTHLTNCPQGFRKRMIIPGLISSYGTAEYRVVAFIHDLRYVIAKFMGRGEPPHGTTDAAIKAIRRHNGEWASLDGGALRMRIYNGVGTAHLEVHPDMAWRLNAVLASLHPGAIPSEFREKPRRKPKDVVLMQRPLPFAVINALATLEPGRELNPRRGEYRQNTFIVIPDTREFRNCNYDKHVMAEAERVLESIGGVRVEGKQYFRFDYDPDDVIGEIVCNGCIPDHKSHQFYPTPQALATRAAELLDAQPDMQVLEPSAGTGNLIAALPAGLNITAVEVSALHCGILKARFPAACVINTDFMKTADELAFDRVIMNPPFDRGQWRAHLEHAARHAKPTGRLVAILPSGAKAAPDLLPGWRLEWHGPYDNQFTGASVSVVILVANR